MIGGRGPVRGHRLMAGKDPGRRAPRAAGAGHDPRTGAGVDGLPMSSENPELDEPPWRYWLSSFDEVQVHSGADGRVRDITAAPGTRNRIRVPRPGRTDS